MNSVLDSDFRSSSNFFKSDLVLQHYLHSVLGVRSLAYVSEKLDRLGTQAATELSELSMTADKFPPVLQKRNFYGENIDKINFHPAYKRMKEIAIESEMLRIKWEPALRQRFEGDRHKLGFSAGFLFAMSESGLYCPLCMTDGVALLIDKYCDEVDKNRLVPHIYSDNVDDFFTGAMFLTEKNAGSDVGAIKTVATHFKDKIWKLSGEKWFCSNASAEIIFTLARTGDQPGTKGLGIFLLEPELPEGGRNYFEIVRLKDKLGTRSMASGEIILNEARAILVGEEGAGFKIMTDMINLSRLYNSVAAVSSARRAIIEAYQFLSFRTTFGKNTLNHALVRIKLFEIGSLYLGNFYALWSTIDQLDRSESEESDATEMLRILTPMLKKSTAEQAVYIVREAMELMGGIGYIEDGVMPKILRDTLVLPIWEGAGNIMILDMIRAVRNSKGLSRITGQILELFQKWEKNDVANKLLWQEYQVDLQFIQNEIENSFKLPQDLLEVSAKRNFEKLTQYYQLYSLVLNYDEESKAWLDTAIRFYHYSLSKGNDAFSDYIPTDSEIKSLISWAI
jgi:acyl-CoA dehydrogenase